jgi:hypothetical protein
MLGVPPKRDDFRGVYRASNRWEPVILVGSYAGVLCLLGVDWMTRGDFF